MHGFGVCFTGNLNVYIKEGVSETGPVCTCLETFEVNG